MDALLSLEMAVLYRHAVAIFEEYARVKWVYSPPPLTVMVDQCYHARAM
jgi:hypothetical protein